jgi:hypothetical protein
MPFEILASLSEPGSDGNEDAFGIYQRDNQLDMWVIDGATSLAEEEHLGQHISDPAWFANNMNDRLKHDIAHGSSPQHAIASAVQQISAEYFRVLNGKIVPIHDRPVAALGWARMTAHDNKKATIDFWSMGDCRFLVRYNGTETFLFPEYPRGDAAKPAALQNDQARNRTGVLLSHIPGDRARREQYHIDPTRGILGFHAQSVEHARHSQLSIQGEFNLLAMSDGFYRLVDEYHLYDDVGLMSAAREQGIAALYQELRAHEIKAEVRRDYAVKRRDDATAIYAQFKNT